MLRSFLSFGGSRSQRVMNALDKNVSSSSSSFSRLVPKNPTTTRKRSSATARVVCASETSFGVTKEPPPSLLECFDVFGRVNLSASKRLQSKSELDTSVVFSANQKTRGEKALRKEKKRTRHTKRLLKTTKKKSSDKNKRALTTSRLRFLCSVLPA